MVFRVLIVEDDKPTRSRLEQIVRNCPELELVAGCATLAQGYAALRQSLPNVALIDLDLPDGSGIDLIRAVSGEGLGTETMVITVFGDEAHVIAAIEAGAKGYLLKDAGTDDVARAIVELIHGGSPISAAIARHILKRVQASVATAAKIALTVRESEVLKLVAKGFSSAEIAVLLGISSQTVISHVKAIYRKLEVHSRAEAVFEAIQMGLIRFDPAWQRDAGRMS
jgi:DNA-binding NarL/FixJ family response regulator